MSLAEALWNSEGFASMTTKPRLTTDPALIFRVTDLFFAGKKTVSEIARETGLTRERVYPLIAEARDRGFVRLVPPVEHRLSLELARMAAVHPSRLRVVDANGDRAGEHVAATAAELVLDLIKRVGTERWCRDEPVRLGLAPGRATLDFTRHLGKLLQSDTDVPRLKVFATAAGGPALEPRYSSSSFFNLLPQRIVREFVGLFAETLVPQDEFAKIRTRPGVKEAFEERDEIDIIVTSMGDIDDEHDLLSMFLRSANVNLEAMKAAGCVGNVQYLPFAKSGPIVQKGKDLRAVTLFDLDELAQRVKMANKHVVLIARECALCRRDRAPLIKPLLTEPRLKVWSELVMDVATASGLVPPRPVSTDE